MIVGKSLYRAGQNLSLAIITEHKHGGDGLGQWWITSVPFQ